MSAVPERLQHLEGLGAHQGDRAEGAAAVLRGVLRGVGGVVNIDLPAVSTKDARWLGGEGTTNLAVIQDNDKLMPFSVEGLEPLAQFRGILAPMATVPAVGEDHVLHADHIKNRVALVGLRHCIAHNPKGFLLLGPLLRAEVIGHTRVPLKVEVKLLGPLVGRIIHHRHRIDRHGLGRSSALSPVVEGGGTCC